MPLFSDPTPRVERKDSLCTVVSVGAESTTHTGKTGVVSWKGRNYGCTIIGSVAAGDKAHFIQTKDGHVWAIKAGSYYRSAYPKRPEEWARKAPASLAILELMKGNPRDRVFQTGKIKAVGANTATVNLRGKDVTAPVAFEGSEKAPPTSLAGKNGLYSSVEKSHIVYDKALVKHEKTISLSIYSGYAQGEIWWVSQWPGPWPWPGGTYSYVYRWYVDTDAVLAYWQAQLGKWFYADSPSGPPISPDRTIEDIDWPSTMVYYSQSISSYHAYATGRLTAYSDSENFEWRYIP